MLEGTALPSETGIMGASWQQEMGKMVDKKKRERGTATATAAGTIITTRHHGETRGYLKRTRGRRLREAREGRTHFST